MYLEDFCEINRIGHIYQSTAYTPGLGILARRFDRPNLSVPEVDKRLTRPSQEQVYRHVLIFECKKTISNSV